VSLGLSNSTGKDEEKLHEVEGKETIHEQQQQLETDVSSFSINRHGEKEEYEKEEVVKEEEEEGNGDGIGHVTIPLPHSLSKPLHLDSVQHQNPSCSILPDSKNRSDEKDEESHIPPTPTTELTFPSLNFDSTVVDDGNSISGKHSLQTLPPPPLPTLPKITLSEKVEHTDSTVHPECQMNIPVPSNIFPPASLLSSPPPLKPLVKRAPGVKDVWGKWGGKWGGDGSVRKKWGLPPPSQDCSKNRWGEDSSPSSLDWIIDSSLLLTLQSYRYLLYYPPKEIVVDARSFGSHARFILYSMNPDLVNAY
ncbi:hypothetical protein ADUPG1_001382, partial [Aduncisulcus paluster]